MRIYRRRKCRETAHIHPLVRQLAKRMHQERMCDIEAAERAGISKNVIKDWWFRATPRLDNLQAVGNVVGLTLVWKELVDVGEEDASSKS